jgi:hypothetical protein
METDKHWATTLPGFAERAQFSPRARTLRTESAFISPVKYPALSLVALAAGHLTNPCICPSLPLRLQDRQEGLGSPSERDMRRHHQGHCGLDHKRGFPRQRARLHRGRGRRVGCRPGACVCGPGRSGGETLDPPWRRAQRYLSDAL